MMIDVLEESPCPRGSSRTNLQDFSLPMSLSKKYWIMASGIDIYSQLLISEIRISDISNSIIDITI